MEFGTFNPVERSEIKLPDQIELSKQQDFQFSQEYDIPVQENSEFDFLRNFKSYDLILQELSSSTKVSVPQEKAKYQSYVGYSLFSRAFDQVELEMPEARKYRLLLTRIALHESGFNSRILNKAGAPAYGYFLFMQDGLRYNNIKAYSGLSIEEFRNNPKELIKAAVRLALKFERTLSTQDITKASSMGISLSGLIGGAWLGGIGGVRKVLNGTGNPSDNHWNRNGKGSNVAECMQRYNNLI